MSTFTEQDHFWMQHALKLAHQALHANEVPVGAVLILNDEIIGEGFNAPISSQDPTAHAEIIAIRNAAEKIQNYRLINSALYVTLEPCLMCAGAIVHSRIQRLVYGANDPRTGVIDSCAQLLQAPFLNHRVISHGGLLKEECGLMLKKFFQARRHQKKL